MEAIKRAGRRLERLAAVLLVLAPVVYVAVYAWQGPLALLQVPASVTVNLAGTGGPDAVWLFLLPMLTPLVYWWAFYFLHDLAGHYASGRTSRLPRRRLRRSD